MEAMPMENDVLLITAGSWSKLVRFACRVEKVREKMELEERLPLGAGKTGPRKGQ